MHIRFTIFMIPLMLIAFAVLAQNPTQCKYKKDCENRSSPTPSSTRNEAESRYQNYLRKTLDPERYIENNIRKPHQFRINITAKKKQLNLDRFIIRSR